MYDYLEAMTLDVLNYLEENKEVYAESFEELSGEELRDTLDDELWAVDEVTGNGDYGYFDDDQAHEAIFSNAENVALLVEALEMFGDTAESYRRALLDPSYADTTIRCYLLGQAVDKALTELGL